MLILANLGFLNSFRRLLHIFRRVKWQGISYLISSSIKEWSFGPIFDKVHVGLGSQSAATRITKCISELPGIVGSRNNTEIVLR